jgi:hypothetical protein
VGRGDSIVELISAMTDALCRNDETDMDSPAWENTLLLERLRVQLRLASGHEIELAKAPVVSHGRFERISAS